MAATSGSYIDPLPNHKNFVYVQIESISRQQNKYG